MSDLAETFQNDISQIFNERGLLRTELIAKEKLLTDAIVQKNTLNQSLKQIRTERDELFVQNQKLKQEKLAAEAEKSASTIHVRILKEEKSVLEEKFYELTQKFENARGQIDHLTRENHSLKSQSTHQVPISIHHTIDHREELEQLKRRQIELEQAQNALIERHRQEVQVVKNESSAKDEQIYTLEQLLGQYEQTITSKEKIQKDLERRIDEVSQSCRSQLPDKMILSEEERRTLENDPNCTSILMIYRSSKSLFDILVDYGLLQKQNENLSKEKEKIDSQRRQNENLLHEIQSELQQMRVQNERLQFLAESRQTEYEKSIREKQNVFKEKIELEKELREKQREFDDCLDDRTNMRAQIFHLLEQGNVKGQIRSLPPFPDAEVLGRQGVVTFSSVDELYEQFMKCLADIRETDRFIVELEETHQNELKEISQREFQLKENLDELKKVFEQTRTDLNIEKLAKQVLDREPTKPTSQSIEIQTEIDTKHLTNLEEKLRQNQKLVEEKTFQINRIGDELKLIQQKNEHFQLQNHRDKAKIDELQRLIDESFQRSQNLLFDAQQSELNSEKWKEEARLNQENVERLSQQIVSLKNEIEKFRLEKEISTKIHDEIVERIRKDVETKNESTEENFLNAKLQQSVDELNNIVKSCVKQTELIDGTPAHLTSLTKLEILYRQLQQRHQFDLERHFAISESLKIKAKEAQQNLDKIRQLNEEMKTKFDDEQQKSAAKIAELESKLRNADTTTVLTRLLPSATLENRLKEEEERTQQLRSWTTKLTEKIENFQKQMATEKKEYEDKIEAMRQELKQSRNECLNLETRAQIAEEQQKNLLNEFIEKEKNFDLEIFKLKSEFDVSHVTQKTLRETLNEKENQIRSFHERILDYENKIIDLEKEFFALKDKHARQTKDFNLPISEPPSPCILPPIDSPGDLTTSNFDENSLETPSKRRRNPSGSGKTRTTRSQSVDLSSTPSEIDDNDDAMSTCSEPPSAKKRKRRVNDVSAARLPAVNEEGDNDDAASAANTPSYNLRSRTKRLAKLQPHQTT